MPYSLRDFQRLAYLASRSAADVDAAQRGRLGQRVARREVTRRIVGPALTRLFR